MPIRYFGIFLAYGPTVDLHKEGLGRVLAAFLKAAVNRKDVRFVIACPQWFKGNLLAFCETEGISATGFDVVSTGGSPFMLRLYLWYLARRRGPRRRPLKLLLRIQNAAARHRRFIERRSIAARSIIPWIVITLYAAILALVLAPLGAFLWLCRAGGRLFWKASKRVLHFFSPLAVKMREMVHEPGEEPLDLRLYRLMEDFETKRMCARINALQHVKAWFCPTAFWPEFNKIKGPTVMCVPDVVPTEFPVGFAGAAPDFRNFETVERSILGAHSFVTYSGRVKWSTLVDRYSVNPANVSVIPHAHFDLSPLIKVRGISEDDGATRAYCESLLQRALLRLGNTEYVQGLQSGSLRFLFYASQFRPNKNLLTLLEAYEHLLRKRFIHRKLILTGDPARFPTILDFIHQHGLTKDVIFLHGLTEPELAACYYLADLAVNPSLSEGGCPFTLTEALSVNTPVVMAQIPVTEEVIADPALREIMLFNPYDYRDASSRIEWALGHRESLLEAQKEAYNELRQRTWRDVVDEYVAILDASCQ